MIAGGCGLGEEFFENNQRFVLENGTKDTVRQAGRYRRSQI